jgi:hypothetical protein
MQVRRVTPDLSDKARTLLQRFAVAVTSIVAES